MAVSGAWDDSTRANQTGAYSSTAPADEAAAAADYIFLKAGDTGTFTFSGLDGASTYDLRLLASRSSGGNRTGDYTVQSDSATTTSFDAFDDGYESGTVLTFNSIVPDSNDEILLSVENSTNFAYTSAITLEEAIPEPGTAAVMVGLGGLLLTRSRRRRSAER